MPRYFVKQPNGMLAEFSTVVDHFVATGMTTAEAEAEARRHMSSRAAREKVRRATDDEPVVPGSRPCCDQGLTRWHYALNTILHVHGTAALAQFLAENPDAYATPAASPGVPPTGCDG
jgi:hypothetical protein